uniref:Myotubularin-related 12-like C-terminal domain-containing protein n=1 Tax=Megaselia scalaris TaxID=36166 RepID=T1H349_MEGSC
MLFTNPFFTKKENTVVRKSLAIPPNAIPLHGLQKSFSSSRLLRDHSLHTDSIPKDKFLSPKWEISSLSVWQQCYHRWIPLFEIKNGGFPHIDLFNRLLLSNINKLQKKLESGYDFYGDDEDDEDTINVIGERIERRHKLSSPNNEINFENVNSFFPFSSNENNSDQLNEILISSNDVLMDGSIMERND